MWKEISTRFLEASTLTTLMPHLVAGFTTREGGVSELPYATCNLGFHVHDDAAAVIRNRERLASDLAFPLDCWVGSEQVHETTIRYVTNKDKGRGAYSLSDALPATDGLYTNESGILLTSLYADCTPLYFVAPRARLIGLCHAGWRGTVQQIGQKLVSLWQTKHHVPIEDIHVFIGPCISGHKYEVDQAVIDRVTAIVPVGAVPPYQQVREGHYTLDLRMLHQQLFQAAGLCMTQIYTAPECTYIDPRFFSYRREKGQTGRMMSVIGMRSGK
ncbi:peptidoglycan editing factor PgeF [Shouchella lonarensis]|uniref:Purine nucleoside phosphorylase n=1 Tax=Shouchella lonarensis TaxID=1464122 RepID=A0A1G6KYY9_9BACI|nr:peptidoglycan editing factor PgeF [Shouchella lonarensis]SDC35576.1 conserved hypothetical protein [Shouchella lonarensis]